MWVRPRRAEAAGLDELPYRSGVAQQRVGWGDCIDQERQQHPHPGLVLGIKPCPVDPALRRLRRRQIDLLEVPVEGIAGPAGVGETLIAGTGIDTVSAEPCGAQVSGKCANLIKERQGIARHPCRDLLKRDQHIDGAETDEGIKTKCGIRGACSFGCFGGNVRSRFGARLCCAHQPILSDGQECSRP
jgi:hypothetical protein